MNGGYPEAETYNGRDRRLFYSSLAPALAFGAAGKQMRSWLRDKSYDLRAFDRGEARLGARAVLSHTVTNSGDDTQTQRWQLDESTDGGTRVSSLTVHAPAHALGAVTWFLAETEFVPEIPESGLADAHWTGAAGLMRRLLADVPAFDSLARLTSTPSVIGAGQTDELIDTLCDPDRRLPTVVASAHPGVGFEAWRRTIRHVTRDLPGLASIYIMDPAGTQAFGEAIGSTHAVWDGGLRTYLPDVDPAVADEALRHRVLAAGRIQADPDRAAAVVSAHLRRLAAEATLPGPLALLAQAQAAVGARGLAGAGIIGSF